MRFLSFAALTAYIGTVYGANWALQKFGIVSIGFGLTAPAGVFRARGLARVERSSTAGLREFSDLGGVYTLLRSSPGRRR